MTKESYRPVVAVAGATGTQGGAATRSLLDQGFRVRALTRTSGSAAAHALRGLGAEVRTADFGDSESLEAALKGADGLFAMSTPFGSDPETEVRQGIDLLEAARGVGVGHIVFTSAAHADRDTGIPHFDSKHRIERRLRGLGVPWTILGPAAFMDNYTVEWSLEGLREGRFVLPMPADRPLTLIPVRDIGAFAAHVLARPQEFAGRRIDIASDQLTCMEIAEALTGACGRPIAFERLPIAHVEAFSADLAAMFRYFTEVGLDVDVDALRRDFPEIGWQRFGTWAAEHTWPVD
ncbi:NmrA/HSCARG family protein [Streptomyces geranii]|uniref:NmrA/HSCARG family protein n=1 Tax=Streptomyces geranii TaxID=2058923 RepID=UPI000D024761|nr:NmrA/HSCARG family protein [Streptomyces geranii]